MYLLLHFQLSLEWANRSRFLTLTPAIRDLCCFLPRPKTYDRFHDASAEVISLLARVSLLLERRHGALLIEGPSDQIDAEVAKLKECMSQASEEVLGRGKVCRVDADIIRYPDRYMDEHGEEMWDRIMNLLTQAQG